MIWQSPCQRSAGTANGEHSVINTSAVN
uniref:Uncharacterized protein n=1 Tax=Anguilla anguilla TaxID=7936 RepID=A0A0E9VMN9_ANGAN